jgi:hypothetical protein
MPDPAKPLRVLVSEGSSTSARETITILGLSGHTIEVCDPSPWCLSRFSRRGSRRHLGAGAFADEVQVQDLIAGTTEKAQSVFCRGHMIGFHAYRKVMPGVGGGEAIKQSVRRPVVRAHARWARHRQHCPRGVRARSRIWRCSDVPRTLAHAAI